MKRFTYLLSRKVFKGVVEIRASWLYFHLLAGAEEIVPTRIESPIRISTVLSSLNTAKSGRASAAVGSRLLREGINGPKYIVVLLMSTLVDK